MNSSKTQIAFLGLGMMGRGMAARLLNAGYPVTVFNRTKSKASELVEAGARLAQSPRAAADQADVVISMVADDVASRGMWSGDDGALIGARQGATMIECSTLSVDWVKELASLASARGCDLIDAPVTGSRGPAALGQLNFFVGGDPVVLERVRQIFTPMAKSVTHLGPIGSGAMIKLINNFMCGVQVASLGEALVMIERGGLNREQALAVLTDGAPGSPLVKLIAPRMTTPDYTPNFLLKLMAKDLGYALSEGEKLSAELATVDAALQVFKKAIAAGHADKDMSAIIEPLRVRI